MKVQFAFGMLASFVMHFSLLEDIEKSMNRQKALLELIDKARKREVKIRDDGEVPISLSTTLKEAYLANISQEVLRNIRGN